MSKSVRCKMRCEEIGQVNGGDKPLNSARFVPVYSGDPESENAKFFRYTPTGELKLGVVNEQHFEVGKEYYIDITLAE